jgi:hypothetical protein
MAHELPREYQLDGGGRRILVGLTHEETLEFEKLDDRLPYDGQSVWPDETLPLLPMEVRWLELWEKHQTALLSRSA